MTESMAEVGDIQICYETMGEDGGDPLLLIMGLGGPLIWWADAFCQELVDRGCYVIRYDNRDCGRSSRLRGRVGVMRSFLGLQSPPYGLADFADDAAGLLDHLGINSAHVAGMSMGGMIAQTLAINHPSRVRSLTSIMSTTGNRLVGWPSPQAMRRLFGRGPRSREEYLRESVKTWRLLSADFPADEGRILKLFAATYDRGLNPGGYFRHVAAINAATDRTRQLSRVRVPTLVIHGTKDPLVNVSGGKATARAIPGAELMLVPGMGHDLPPEKYTEIAEAIARNMAKAADDRAR